MTDWPVDAEQLEKVKNGPRSVSQVKEWHPALGGCGYRYYLNRVVGAWDRPAAWLPQGTAVHEAAEKWEKSGRTMSLEAAQDAFREAYTREVNRMTGGTPNLAYWSASGPYRGEEDIERRYKLGLEQVERYIRYYTDKAPNEVIWITPDGEPAIELAFDFELDGIRMRGYIDQVIRAGGPIGGRAVVVRDIKTGNNPGDAFQLSVYAEAIEAQYDQGITSGDYWMGRQGKPTKPYLRMPGDDVARYVREMDEGVKAGRFEPNPDPDRCRFCSVSNACKFSMS